MSYYLVKANLRRSKDAKVKKESFIVKAPDLIAAEQITATNLLSVDSSLSITDINLKNYKDVFTTADNTGPFYELSIEWEDLDSKVVKESYLQQAGNTVESEAFLITNVGDYFEVVSNKKTTISDYFIGE
jgi:hypothetical protein